MNTIFNFQNGDFYNSSPDWLTYVSLLFTILGPVATLAAIYYAYDLYKKQRFDNSQDASALFQASLIILKDAVGKTIELLGEFKDSLSNENDNFKQPSLPVNLNDKFLSRIDLTSLTRYYKEKENDKYEIYFEFLKRSGYIATYHGFYLNELNSFRSVFASKEAIFQQHSLLIATKYHEVFASYRAGTTAFDFADGYRILRERLLGNSDIVSFDPEPENGVTLKNRTKLVTEFIKPLIALSQRYVYTDAKANEVYTLANQILAARVDIDNLKKQWADNSLKDSIAEFEKIQEIIQKLT